MDVGAMAGAQTLGVVFFGVGRSPDKEVDIFFSGNSIRNVSEPAINFRVPTIWRRIRGAGIRR
jgi:hypothetical protein